MRGSWCPIAERALTAFITATAVMALAGAAQAAPPLVGTLTPVAPPGGCFTAMGGVPGCTVPRGIDGPESVLVSPDGKNVYVGNYNNGSEASLVVFARDAATGALTQLAGTAGCLTADGNSAAGTGTCTRVRGFGNGDGRDATISSDGRWLYMVSQHSGSGPVAAIMIFSRDPTTGALTQLSGSAGCISSDGSSQDGAGTCQTLAVLNSPNAISMSPDEHTVYVDDYGTPSRVLALARDGSTGALTGIQCLSEAPAPAGCATARILGNSQPVLISPNGEHAYVAQYASDGLAVLDRDPATGLLSQKPGPAGCLSDTGHDDTGAATCTVARVLGGAYGLSVSPDGAFLYVSAFKDLGFASFHIASDGSLTQLAGAAGCTTATGNDNLGDPTCASGRGLSGPYGTTISSDGRTLYVSDFGDATNTTGGVAVFSLDPTTGAATQLAGLPGCFSVDGSSHGVAGACTVGGTQVAGAYAPTVSPDGNSLYLPGDEGHTLSVFTRENGPVCTAATAATAAGTPVTVALTCNDADGVPITRAVASAPAHGSLSAIAQPAGTVAYTPAAGYAGSDSFTFTASDGTNTSLPATATITVSPQAPSVTITSPLANAQFVRGQHVVASYACTGGAGASLNSCAGPVASQTALSTTNLGPHSFTVTAADSDGQKAAKTVSYTVVRAVTVSSVSQAHRRWREGHKRKGVPSGTAFSFVLSQAATVHLRFTHVAAGRRLRNHRCVAPTRSNRGRPACRHAVTVATLTVKGAAGRNRVTFSGRIHGHGLKPGTYTLLITATLAGTTSTTHRLTFTIVH